jgi:hypothetical protein
MQSKLQKYQAMRSGASAVQLTLNWNSGFEFCRPQPAHVCSSVGTPLAYSRNLRRSRSLSPAQIPAYPGGPLVAPPHARYNDVRHGTAEAR